MTGGKILIGTCGFAESHRKLFGEFDILEVQQTFYQPPRLSTAERWREEAPEEFVFTLKAWQLITHEARSPTYRRLKENLTDSELTQTGSFRWNPVTRMARERTRAIAEALQAGAVLFQTPRSFPPTAHNLECIRRFFGNLDRGALRLVFEPRGEAWTDGILRPLLRDLQLVHGVDPFLRQPLGRGLRYFRLHGRPAYHYHYRYSEAELLELKRMMSGSWPHWVLFNNDSMVEDARRFRSLVNVNRAGS